jgi:hypothetical protein
MLMLAVALSLAPPSDVSVSTRTAKPPPIEFRLDQRPIEASEGGRGGRAGLGVSIGLKEGKPLEVLVWGSGGAVAGSLAGPPGALIGGAAGALCGLIYSKFVVPRNGPVPVKR